MTHTAEGRAKRGGAGLQNSGQSIEQLAQRIFDARGYIVFASFKDEKPGTIVQGITGLPWTNDLEAQVVVIGETGIDDMNAQRQFAGC